MQKKMATRHPREQDSGLTGQGYTGLNAGLRTGLYRPKCHPEKGLSLEPSLMQFRQSAVHATLRGTGLTALWNWICFDLQADETTRQAGMQAVSQGGRQLVCLASMFGLWPRVVELCGYEYTFHTALTSNIGCKRNVAAPASSALILEAPASSALILGSPASSALILGAPASSALILGAPASSARPGI